MLAQELETVLAAATAIFVVVGCFYAAWRTVRKQTDEKEQDRAMAAVRSYAEVMEKERNDARTQRDLNAAERDHAIEQAATLRTLADNTPRLDQIISLLKEQNERLKRIEERGRANS